MESLYRKYRPQTFADVVGQSHVVTTLERAVLEGRTSHAYLFCGPRGTGKTTMARLLAKALMCERGRQQLPDGTCDQCRQIAAGEHPDVYELDAASRTGVDNVREEIINRVGYAPVQAPVKLYIIDEVHMLTTQAFNALLKTLEEPPEHVVFVLCTTDPQKIPQTILSRVQRFEFRPIGDTDIEQRLAYVCEQEGFTFEQEALKLIAANARGGMRDALSSLEQVSVFGGGNISVQAARDMVGSLPEAELDKLVAALAARDAGTAFAEVQSLSDGGADLLRVVGDLAVRMRDVYVVAVAGDRAISATSATPDRLLRDVRAFGTPERIARILGLLSDVSREMATAPDQRLCLEIALTRIVHPESDLTLESLAERIAELEAQIAHLKKTGVAVASAVVTAETAERRVPAASSGASEASQKAPAPARAVSQATDSEGVVTPQEPAPASHGAAVAQTAPTRESAPAPSGASQAQVRPVERVEARPAPRHTERTNVAQGQGMRPEQTGASPAQRAPKASRAGSAAVVDAGALQRMWKQVSSTMFKRDAARGTLLSSSRAISDDGSALTVQLPHGSAFSLRMLERPEVRKIVDSCVKEVFGERTVRFEEAPAPEAGSGAATGRVRVAPQASRQMPPQTTQPQYHAPAPAPSSQAQPMPWDEPAAPLDVDMQKGYDGGAFGEPVDDYLDGYMPLEAQQDLGATAAPERRQAPQPAAVPAQVAAAPAQVTPMKEGQKAAGDDASAQVSEAMPQESEAEQAAAKALADPELADLPPDLIALLEDAFEVFGPKMQVKRTR